MALLGENLTLGENFTLVLKQNVVKTRLDHWANECQ